MDDPADRLPTIGVALAVLLASTVIYRLFFHPLASVPGPFLAKLTSAWLAYAYWRQDWHTRAIELHKQYGPVIRIAPNAVDVGDPEAVKIIYGAGTKFWKGSWYSQLKVGSNGKTLLGVTDRAEHRQLRRLLDPLYTLKSVRESEELFDDPIEFFTEQMKAKDGQVVDMGEWMVAFAVDAFTAMTYGERYGCLEKGHALDMRDAVDQAWMPYTPLVMLAPSFGWAWKKIQWLIVVAKVIAKGGKPPLEILGWIAGKVKSGLAADAELSDTPTLFERSRKLHKDSPEDFPKAALNTHMFEIVFAGFETCGATLPKIMHYIASTPGCQNRLRKELEAAKQPSGLDGLSTYGDLLQIPYLAACIHEGFRIDPITGISLSRKVPADGVSLNGFNLPGGTEIGMTPWVVSYDERMMPQPKRFRPERWLEATKEERSTMERTDLFFGGGPSSCPGKVLATALLYKVIAVVFSNFEVEVVGSPENIKVFNRFPVKWENVKLRLSCLKAD